jgi:hypothetical protein
MLTKIFLNSLILFSCSKYPEKIYSVDVPHQQFNGYKLDSVDKNTCELSLSDAEIIPFSSQDMNGAVCITRQEYKKLQAHYRSECLNSKKPTPQSCECTSK